MILPEHRRAIQRHTDEIKKKTKPNVYLDALEEIDRKLRESMELGKAVTLIVFDEYKDKEYYGIIRKLDTSIQRIKIETASVVAWIPFNDIISVR
jgi:predicted Ser/Thr protein kinase